MRRTILVLVVLASLAGSITPAAAAEPWTTVTLMTYAEGSAAVAAAAKAASAAQGEEPGANGESNSFELWPDRRRWKNGPRVEYKILNAPFGAADNAIVRGEREIDPYVTTRNFRRNDNTTDVDPCGLPNGFRWAPIDGPGNVVAQTVLCVNESLREIGGFRITFDSGDGWAIGKDGDLATYDVENVAVHEWGHVAGLLHVERKRDKCLTMYFSTNGEETEQRTLGWGDKRGLNRLYDHGDTSPGPGCGR